jgi:hypothetical protein
LLPRLISNALNFIDIDSKELKGSEYGIFRLTGQ